MDNLTFNAFNYATIKLSQIGKSMLCQIERGPSDNPPLLLWQGLGEDDIHILPLDEDVNRNTMLRKSLVQALAEFGRPRYIAVIAEAYLQEAQTIEEIEGITHGELQDRFLNEFDASIREVISIVCFDLTGNISLNIAEYVYDDAGLPVFSEVKTTEIEKDAKSSGGLVVDVIKEFVELVNIT